METDILYLSNALTLSNRDLSVRINNNRQFLHARHSSSKFSVACCSTTWVREEPYVYNADTKHIGEWFRLDDIDQKEWQYGPDIAGSTPTCLAMPPMKTTRM